MRVLIVEDEPYLAEAIRTGLRLAAIAADVAGDGHAALELLDVNRYDVVVLDRDIPGPSGDDVARRIDMIHRGFHRKTYLRMIRRVASGTPIVPTQPLPTCLRENPEWRNVAAPLS